MDYIHVIGREHLNANDYCNKRRYDELDVFNFDNHEFLEKLADRNIDEAKRNHVIEDKQEMY